MSSTEALIEKLAGEAKAVRRLRPPLVRAALWLSAVAAVAVALNRRLRLGQVEIRHQRLDLGAAQIRLGGPQMAPLKLRKGLLKGQLRRRHRLTLPWHRGQRADEAGV